MIKKYFTKQYWKGQRLLLLAFLLFHTVASFYYISQQNITYDEPDYIEYAKRWLHGHPERIQSLDDSKSPIVAISWVPRIVRQVINPNYHLSDYGRQDQREGRYMMIFFSFIAAFYVYRWCKDLYGASGWQLPLLMLLFDPLYLSYTTLITTDLACGSFLAALLYHFRKYLVLQSRKDFYYAAIFTTIAIFTKQSLLFVLLLLPLLSIWYKILVQCSFRFNKRTVTDVLIFLLIFLVGINVGYYFNRTFMPFGNYVFESNTLRSLQQSFTFLRSIPVPLPFAYVQSVDMIKAHSEVGAGTPLSTTNGVYLFGELRLLGGYWYYYLVLLFYKLPIGTMLLLLACIPIFLKKFNRVQFAKQYLFLLLPIVFYWIILSFFNQFQSGVRHILLVFPLVFIGLGYLFKQVRTANKKWKIATGAAVVYTFVTVMIYYPHIIPYTNEFITSKKTVYHKIYDSSVDYGQSDSTVPGFIKLHPEYKPATSIPTEGKYAVLTGDMLNTYLRNSSKYKWYMAFEPTSHYRYTVLLFDIKKEDIERTDFNKADFKIIAK
jgi:hypothetical protein